ncbi:hypothetical protein PXK58_11225 [Phaeobacter gallaeciensis]|uniref:hypothetical protein n=1 Tax=Phaeobacter gallaeciensis TaxID=60890 RepID=UPI00237FF837|nr:hypothetical protein [Phaeobacter gallaeciensis]MDE4274961.1 hypothetical protein [Phaeobacter gallaeciensis]MDE4300122.1 hypothetical protein [Phaeobacter gallaeciensis]MDE5185286.1 hypothetical protein [Phaeobacter gallaeciensis]
MLIGAGGAIDIPAELSDGAARVSVAANMCSAKALGVWEMNEKNISLRPAHQIKGHHFFRGADISTKCEIGAVDAAYLNVRSREN